MKEESASPLSAANVSGSAGSENNATAAVDVNSLLLLSQSAPTNWGSGGQGGAAVLQQPQQLTNDQLNTEFNTSVDKVGSG